MADPFYLVYLASVGRNRAVYSVITKYLRHKSKEAPWEGEIRYPDFVRAEGAAKALYSLDKAAPVICTWQDFYTWLGRGSGWASFGAESAAELVPHWFSPKINYHCVRYPFLPFWVEFADAKIDPDRFSSMATNLIGPALDEDAYLHFRALTSNMVLTESELFSD